MAIVWRANAFSFHTIFFHRIDLTADSNAIVSEVLEHCKNADIKTNTQNTNDTNSDTLDETMGGGGANPLVSHNP